jgi:DNA-directed RNA polymerase beta subunit
MRITVTANLDEQGDPEEFTFDLFEVVPGSETLHLDSNGLPRVGTVITPGMIIVGKIGKRASFDRERRPNALELHSWSFEEIRAKYGSTVRDGAIHADATTAGIVVFSALTKAPDGRDMATVVIEQPPKKWEMRDSPDEST